MITGTRSGLTVITTGGTIRPTAQDIPTKVLPVCLFAVFGATFTVVVLVLAVKPIGEDLETSQVAVTWAVTAPMLLQAVLIPVLGRAGDIFGHRRILRVGLAVSTASAVLIVVSNSIWSLVLIRCVQQIGGAAVVPAATAILFYTYPIDRRSHVAAWAGTAAAASTSLGLAIGGPLIDLVGWRSIFVLQGILCGIALLAGSRFLHEVPRVRDIPLDIRGATLLAAGLFALVVSLNRAPEWGPTDARVLACGLLAVPLLSAFVVGARKTTHPLIEPSLLTNTGFLCPAVASFLLMIGVMGTAVTAPLLMQNLLLYSASTTAAITLIRPVIGTASTWAAGGLIARLGVRTPAAIGAGAGLVQALCFMAGAQWSNVAFIVAGLTIGGISFGLFGTATQTQVSLMVGPSFYGVGISGLHMAQSLGAVFGTSMMSSVAADAAAPAPYVRAFLIAAIASALTLFAATTLRSFAAWGSGPLLVTRAPQDDRVVPEPLPPGTFT